MEVFLFLGIILAVYFVSCYVVDSNPFWFVGQRVYLLNRWEDIQYTTYINTDANGVKWAYVFPATKIGHVILRDDMTTGGESTYIKKWSYKRFDVRALRNSRYN